MVLAKNVPSQSFLQRHCEHLIDLVSQEGARCAPGCQASCCVGAALTPEDGSTFDELFPRAEQALRAAKRRGPGSCAFYQQGEQLPGEASSYGPIESDSLPGLADQSLVRYAFNLLYQSGDVERTIQSILELVGRQMNVSRVYIFENSPDNRFCYNTFEWCNEGISPEMDNLQGLSYETDIWGWQDNYNDQGVFLCENLDALQAHHRAILEPQGIKSMLQCAIMDGGVFRGFVGLDECVVERAWTREQLDALSMVSELTAVFLLKKRVQDTSDQMTQSLVGVLENSMSWIYVIDPDTYEILFSNAKLKSFFPQAAPGSRCHDILMNRDAPCENCAARDIRLKKRNYAELINKHVGLSMKAEASLIHWEGREAALIEFQAVPWKKNDKQ